MNNSEEFVPLKQCLKEFDQHGCVSDTINHLRRLFETYLGLNGGEVRWKLDVFLRTFKSNKN